MTPPRTRRRSSRASVAPAPRMPWRGDGRNDKWYILQGRALERRPRIPRGGPHEEGIRPHRDRRRGLGSAAMAVRGGGGAAGPGPVRDRALSDVVRAGGPAPVRAGGRDPALVLLPGERQGVRGGDR